MAKATRAKSKTKKGAHETTSKRAGGKSKKPAAAQPLAPAEHELLTMPEAIDRLKTTRATFYRWLKAGRIQGVKVGRQWRFAREQIERFLSGEESSIDLTADLAPLFAQLNDRYRELTGRDFETAGDVDDVVALMTHLGVWMRASDIHIEPQAHADASCPPGEQAERASIRFRIDGLLHPIATFDLRLLPVVIDRWKATAKCDVRERVRPQDGRIVLGVGSDDLPERPLDLRVSFLPAALGECLTARLLDREAVNISLERLGFDDVALDRLQRGLSSPNGLILVTGPTGSGKTTTLYACLREIVRPDLKVMSVEDPVEYFVPGVAQTSLRAEVGLSFPVVMRSILRSDPDAVLVGELRDLDTLNMCFQTALTGHLVLSTLHSSGAVGALERMTNMGAAPFLLADTVRMALAQRLVRRLCPECNQPDSPSRDVVDRCREMLKQSGTSLGDLEILGFRKAVGCPKCRRTGYSGRMGLIEILEMTPELGRAVVHGASVAELQAIAIGQGMTTMTADGVRRAAAGETTLEEVLRVLAMR